MKSFIAYITNFATKISDQRLILITVLLAIPAFLISLGALTFIGDEAIRSQVALEMKYSGNYIAPTLYGAYYFNKPPLYNWFILAVSELWGSYGEWPARLTTLFFLITFAGIVFRYMKQHFEQLTAAILTFMLLTSGRILLWDSMLGLIDICFSGVIFLNFMVLYHLGIQKKWLQMFLYSYLLGAAAFLLKGIPAIVFQAISVPLALYLHGSFRQKIISKAHFSGIAAALIPVLTYYVLYAREVSLQHAFSILFDQSLQRTATHHGWYNSFIHLFTFPVEQIYHFMPWSLLIILVFHPRSRHWINDHSFIRFNFWMLIANLPVYWTSYQVYPRYLLMFVPMFNVIAWYLLEQSKTQNIRWWQVIRLTFIGLSVIIALFSWGIPLTKRAWELPWLLPAWIGCSLTLTFVTFAMYVDSRRLFLWMTIVLLTLRIGIDAFVIPFRMIDDKAHFTRIDAARLGERFGSQNWYVFGDTETHRVAGFYTTRAAGKIIHKTNAVRDTNGLYFVDLLLYPEFKGKAVDSIRLENGAILPFMQVKNL